MRDRTVKDFIRSSSREGADSLWLARALATVIDFHASMF
jgi:hypothetical protein